MFLSQNNKNNNNNDKEAIGCNAYVYGIGCIDCFMGVSLSPNSSNCIH